MLTTLDHELLAEDARRIAAEDAAEQRRVAAVLNAERAMRERQEAERKAEEERGHWRDILGACAYLDSLPESRKDLLIRAFQRAAIDRPEHTSRFLRAIKMVRPIDVVLGNVSAAPVSVVEDLTHQRDQQSATERAEAIEQMQRRIKIWFSVPAPKSPTCFTTTVRLQRRNQIGGVETCAKQVPCRSCHCRHCFRERKVSTLKTGNRAILDASASSNEVRTDALYHAVIVPSRLKALAKAIHRKGGTSYGYGYIHFDDDLNRLRVLVWTTVPLDEATAIQPAALALKFSKCVETMCPKKHSFRLLGGWEEFLPERSKEWEFVAATGKRIDWDEADAELRAIGVEPVCLRGNRGSGLLFAAKSLEGAEAIWKACPSFASWGKSSKKRNSDKDPVTIPTEWIVPDYDPGATPWG